MLPASSKRITIPDGVLSQEINDETVLLNLASETYFGLDDVASRMWSALTAAGSIQAACSTLLAEYAVDPLILQRDLQTFIEKLSQYDLVEVVD
ncbi:MAG TPA: PqqD family protein [Anaerolineaceae bacterium]|nr:PqqD family protein [Anaerolineaceae bacterium]